MSLTKVTSGGITDSAVTETKLDTGAVTENKIGANAVTTGKISDGAVSADDLASTLDLSSKTVTLPAGTTSALDQNIALLGFKMAVNDGLTVFNLVDGVVDEFNDESGTDESEGSNDLYDSTNDYYINSTTPDGNPQTAASAGFSTATITEPDTSTAGTNPGDGSGTPGTFTVPTDVTSINVKMWSSGGAASGSLAWANPAGTPAQNRGGGGGFVTGDVSVTPGQVLYVIGGEGGASVPGSGGFGGVHPGDGEPAGTKRGGGNDAAGQFGGGGGLSYLGTATLGPAPDIILIAGAGGGGGGREPGNAIGGAGGGLTGYAGSANSSNDFASQTNANGNAGGGGDQEQGGQGAHNAGAPGPAGPAQSGGFLYGGNASSGGGGGAGYYGGGGADRYAPAQYASPTESGGSGGGGSSYYGSPLVTSGSTTAGGDPAEMSEVANQSDPDMPNPFYGEGGQDAGSGGRDGFIFISATTPASTTSSTVISSTFTATSEPSTARIVVFQENIDTPTLNTDVIASVSRDGTNFSNATLTDSGYVTGSSGQRILTGTVDVSGQPTGTSMRWKLALANNAVKIHGVSLQWK